MLRCILKAMDNLASDSSLEKTISSLKQNGIEAEVVSNTEDAKQKVLSLIPKGAEVMTMQSMSLKTAGITEALDTPEYNSVRNKLSSMDRATQSLEMQKLGAAPEYTVGSVHAITEDGKVLVASNTGSQLPAYVYASPHVIWVVGTQKIVPDVDTAIKRIYDYVLPLESERMSIQVGDPNLKSNVSKLLIINKEVKPGRLHIIFVKEKLGF